MAWDPVTWSLALRSELFLSLNGIADLWGLEALGERLVGLLDRYRQPGRGLAVSQDGWERYPYAVLRTFVEETGGAGRGLNGRGVPAGNIEGLGQGGSGNSVCGMYPFGLVACVGSGA